MATITTYGSGATTVADQRTVTTVPNITFIVNDIDVAKLAAAVTTSDKIQVMSLPMDAFVEEITVQVLGAETVGTTATLNVGDGAVAAGYGNYTGVNAAGMKDIPAGSATTYLYTVTTNAKLKPKRVSSANEQAIFLAPLVASLTNAKIRVTAKLLQV